MPKRLKSILCILCLFAAASPAFAASRIKDIGHFSGVRSNPLIGYGLVIGLNKTGDKQQTFFTQQTLLNMLERFGLSVNNPGIRVQNIAAVMVTADLGAFEKPGSRIDVTVSSIGDATSLQGGILLQTPLIGPDSNVYAVAQGALVLGGFSAGNASTGVTVNHPTVGRVPNGANVERTVVGGFPQTVDTLELVLDHADFTTVKRAADALNTSFGRPIAIPVDGRSIRLAVPADYQQRPIEFMSAIEAVAVDVDSKAKVVVNERTGTVIIGSDVTISPVSISHGNLSISIETQFNVSQAQPLAQGGQTVVVPEQKVTAQEQKSNFVTLGRGATVDELIRALNALGVTPRDTIAILEALKTAGALQAELEII
ncbi:MAG TPA: flagellar basal body P-ring protein FlgI [Terriglobia bacterium]|nr:flagellar basal body P-ring protein FlgI [Terriglobia bacterium]